MTDLAGVLALATHGTGDRALPKRWTTSFITATTKPSELYEVEGSIWDKNTFSRTEAEIGRDQDQAKRSNPLLLLSRSYWSYDFLMETTKRHYAFDREEGDDTWPRAKPDSEVGYAPSPSGNYLTDGVPALVAALAANPAASEWAFADFKPGKKQVEDTDYSIGRFTRFLLFEHEFPEGPDDEIVGMTTILTALSSAFLESSGTKSVSNNSAAGRSAASRDIEVLKDLSHELKERSGCSWIIVDFVASEFKAVWRWIKRWGHLVLDILTVAASFAPPPFSFVALGTGVLNATWYAIDQDFTRRRAIPRYCCSRPGF